MASKVYPFPINYKSPSGAYKAIDPTLIQRAGSIRQRSNNLGIELPANAQGTAHLGTKQHALTLTLEGANGRGHLSGRNEAFGRVRRGVSLRYESANTGLGYQAKLASPAAAVRGLRWRVQGSHGLSARVVQKGVQFRNGAGRVVAVLAAPTARLSNGRPLPLRVSLSRSRGDVVVAISAETGSALSGETADVLGAPTGPGGGPAGYPAYESGWYFTGGIIYTDIYAPGSGDSSSLTGSCTIDSTTPNTSLCNQATNYVGPNDRTLLSFDVKDNLPDHIQVLDAYVGMHVNSETSTTPGEIGMWSSNKPWTNLATWNKYDGTNAWTPAGGDLSATESDWEYIGASGDVGQNFFWDLDSTVQGWLDGTSTNDGVEFAPVPGAGSSNKVGFDTGSSSTNYPYIFVYYEPRIGNYPGARYDSQGLTSESSLGVNVASGNLEVSNQDLNLTGVDGQNLSIGRTYNDLSSDKDAFGIGWTMTGADTYIAVPNDQQNTFIYSDGSGDLQTYHQDALGNWVYPPGNDAVVSMTPSGTYSATQYTLAFRHSGITETFTMPSGISAPQGHVARLTSIKNADGDTITYHYTAGDDAQLQTITDTYGNTTTITYNTAGYVSKITDPTGRVYNYWQDANGDLTKYEDPAGNYTYYAYDAYGNLTQITTPKGNIVKVAYDAGNTNRVTSIERFVHPTDTSGPTTSYTYEAATSACSPTNSGWQQAVVTDPKSHATNYCTDDLGRIMKVIDANGHSRSDTYTADGFAGSQTSGLGTPTTFTYASGGSDNLTNTTTGSSPSGPLNQSATYTGTGCTQTYLPCTQTDTQGNMTKTSYNTTGDPLTITDSLAANNQATLTYNSNGTVATSIDADGNTTTYHYSTGNQNLTSVVAPTGAGLNTINLTYDTANRLKTVSTIGGSPATGHEVDYTYNVFGQPATAIYKNAAGTTVATITYTYDADGNLTKRVDTHGTATYTYDGLGRLTAQTFPDGTSDSYGYDAASNLTSLTDAGGTVTYAYDPANQLTGVSDPGALNADTLTYDADGNLTKITYPSGAMVQYTYNVLDQLTNVADTYKTSGGSTAQLTYANTYTSSAGTATQLIQSTTNQAGAVTTDSYDALNRLTEAKTVNGASTLSDYQYTMDGNGNLLHQTVSGTAVTASTTTQAYKPGNEICWSDAANVTSSCSGTPPTGSHSFSYDTDGNETSNGNGLTMSYNALSQMTSATNAGTTTNYTYLGEGQNQIATEGTAALHNDALGLASHGDGSGTDYFTRSDAGQQLDLRASAGTYNYLYDSDGNIAGLTDSAGHLVNQYTYAPYGGQTATGTAPDYFGFQSGFQTAAGLDHFGARSLVPGQGSWSQEDPLSQIQSLTENDRYGFVGDDPLNNEDPDGTNFIILRIPPHLAEHIGEGLAGGASLSSFGLSLGPLAGFIAAVAAAETERIAGQLLECAHGGYQRCAFVVTTTSVFGINVPSGLDVRGLGG